MRPLILDTGALLAIVRRSRTMWVVLDQAQREGRDVLVPAGTLVESIRGGPQDALVNRLLKRPGTQVTIHDEERARAAGALIGESSTTDPIDALVAAIATSDPDDIEDLAGGHRHITAIRV